MKKIIVIFCFLLSFVFMLPNINAKENVYIDSAIVEDKSTTSIENSDPEIDGLKIKFDVSFNNVNDFIKYKITINNNTNIDYEIDTESTFKDSEYIRYQYSFNNGNSTVKNNSTTTIFVIISYVKAVPNELLENDRFVENNGINIELSNDVNPETGDINYKLIILCVLIIAICIYRLFYKKSKNELAFLILLCTILIPSSFAIEKLQIVLETKITIEKEKNVLESRYPNKNRVINLGTDVEGEYDNYTSVAERDFWQYAPQIQTITFNSSNIKIDNYKYRYDVSERKNNSIIAYLVENGNNCGLEQQPLMFSADNNCYDLTIVSDGPIYANQDSSFVFADMSNLNQISGIENYNTSFATSMKAMFYNMAVAYDGGIAVYNIPNNIKNVNQDIIIRTGAQDSSLRINFRYFNTSNVTDMSYMFANNENIESLDLSYFDTSKVENMKNMFWSSYLVSLNLSSFNTSKVTDMSGMFYRCKNIVELDLSHFNTSSVTNMNSMFNSCENLQSLDVSHFDTSKVTNMDYMFSYCKNLSELDLSHFNTPEVTTMKYMFYGCYNLPELDLTHFNTSKVTDMSFMFHECFGLSSLDLSRFDTSNVTNMTDMFYGCINLESLDMSNFNTSKVTSMNGMFGKLEKITELNISHFDTSSVEDMTDMFFENYNLESLDLSHFNTSKVTNMEGMFSHLRKVTELDLSHFDTSKVTSMYNMFYDCSNLVSLDLSSFNTSSVTNMRSMFEKCLKLPNLNLFSFDTSNVTDMIDMFKNCTMLSSIEVSNKWDTSKVTISTNMFYGDRKLRNYNSLTVDATKANTGEDGYLTLSEPY